MDDQTKAEQTELDQVRSGQTRDTAIPDGAKQFPCVKCGGPLVFMPGSTHLKCPYCNTENDIPIDKDDKSYLTEHDYLKALQDEEAHQQTDSAYPTQDVVRCTYCGANTTISERKTSDLCPYCAHPLAMTNLSKVRLNVQALLPFQINSDKAVDIYRNWVKSRWFAPNDFKWRATRGEAMKGIYMPYWTYDAIATSYYTGQRGDVYYVTQMVPVTVNGRTQMQAQQVPRIRWTRVSGNVQVGFDDILIPAAKSVPPEIQDGLKPWNLQKLAPFRREFLAGFVTETYQVELKDGFGLAKERMQPHIMGAIQQDIGGDQQRVDSQKTQYAKVTFKHILLPVWLSAYAYGGETYRFTINAQTGEVSGNRPYSKWKIGLTILLALALLIALFFGLGGPKELGFDNWSAPTYQQEERGGYQGGGGYQGDGGGLRETADSPFPLNRQPGGDSRLSPRFPNSLSDDGGGSSGDGGYQGGGGY